MKLLYLGLPILISYSARAQEASPSPAPIDSTKASYLNEVVVSANKTAEPRRNVGQQVTVISQSEIRNFNAQNIPDLISNSGVVAIQKSQQGGGSPVLRGFEASRVLLVVDGVRMNNLIYRAGHLQNSLTLDNNSLDRAEILFGPSSTLYGSDALGGVIHFYTRNPQLAKTESFNFGGNAFVRYGSANKEKTGHIDLNLGGKKFGSLTSFTFSDFDDLKMGEKTNKALGEPFGLRTQYAERAPDNQTDILVQNNDPYVQKSSGYSQWDLLQKFLCQSNENTAHLLNFQFSNSTNVPRYDRLTDPKGTGLNSAAWYYGPQKRLLTSYQLNLKALGALADAMTTTASYQRVEESRHNRNFGSNNRNDRIEKVNVLGLTVGFQKKINNNSLRYGFDAQFNSLASTAQRVNVATGEVSAQSTRYPDGENTMDVMAVYFSNTLKLSPVLALNYGGRIGTSRLRSTFVDKTFFPFPFDEVKQNNIVSSSFAGFVYTPLSWKLSLTGSSGFRAPNIDDLSKVFESAAGSVIVPNPDLGPERTINAEAGIAKFFGSFFQAEGNFFATQFDNAIVTLPGTFLGQSQIDYDGTLSQVLANQNKGKAYILGYSLNVQADLSKHFAFTAAHNYTKGRVKNEFSTETPLDHIAPAFGRIGMRYRSAVFTSELFANFSAKKKLEDYSPSGEDNLVYAPASGMPRWYTLNFRASYQINKTVIVQAGADNLLDLQYRTFASGINAPGRNLFCTVRVKF